jgi:hypothetical protein
MGPCPGLAAVCDDVRRQVPPELGHDALVVCLPCGQNDADRQAIVVHERVDLGYSVLHENDRWRDPRPLFTARRMLEHRFAGDC